MQKLHLLTKRQLRDTPLKNKIEMKSENQEKKMKKMMENKKKNLHRFHRLQIVTYEIYELNTLRIKCVSATHKNNDDKRNVKKKATLATYKQVVLCIYLCCY